MPPEIRRLLVGTDFSDASESAARFALRIRAPHSGPT